MPDHSYGAIIRSHARTRLLEQLIVSLRTQTNPPRKIIIVDSSPKRTDFLDLLALDVEIVSYPQEPFNFSKAINIGISAITSSNVLIISSHMSLKDRSLIERGMMTAAQNGIDAITWLGPLTSIK